MAKILLVEDDKSLREIYGVRLMAEGYTIISAGDGEEALAVAIKERPDLIVSDVMMPKISGFDMLDILRSTTETKEIKVIMMTALSSEDQRARGEALGADRYLVKSQVGIEDVVRTVHDVLADGIGGGAAPAAAPVAAAPAAPAPVLEPIPAPIVDPTPPQPAAAPAPIEAPIAPVAYAEPVVEPAPIAPAPVAPIIPEAIPAPIPEPIPAPIAPLPVEAPVFTPAPAPVTPIAPAPVAEPTPAPAAFTAPTPLPQPTAPFSSDPPASLGDRVIHPLPTATDLGGSGVADIAAQMNQELNAHIQGLEQPAAPVVPVAPIAAPAAPAQYAAPPVAPTQYAAPPQPPVQPLPPQPGI